MCQRKNYDVLLSLLKHLINKENFLFKFFKNNKYDKNLITQCKLKWFYSFD